ncbi:ABC transporter ATP-binding protein [Trueperella pyogenes]|uniref:ATP-binding cassette domain-containing protein n=1 Tax=Trueperella pyogenes TaxID=1661 RepID=UPI00057C4E4D|nr:ABC transporter ATP-binding protein [Trueperella pyogenes]AJC69093.1 peptide ABC transporter ATPase [Trueperella pyogenes TP8]ALD73780.1 ABC transporter ATP-binding protein [Trueperella pyogenes]MBB3025238.1 peptide/nickel transport system ATP-binding protein [Trueperella pyogenes]MCI7690034.1 ABC transporter ATP-binding protein [Trueperella pyogenes]QIU86883.1 ABC transporter ATP-binding protein [Trueperella pyogenes]
MLEVRDLSISFAGTTVVDRVSFSVAPGERVCLIGESGSGKSLTALAIDGLLPASAQVTGSILFRGAQIVGAGEAQLQNIRGEQIGFVFQEPHTALNPVLRVEKQIVAALAQHRRLRRKDRRAAARQLARGVGLPESIVERFPHQLSGGQRQRVVIAMAMSCQPSLLIADEPTTALDATVQRRIVDLMMNATQQHGTSLLMITHDMALAAHTAQRLIVMRQGEIVEEGRTLDVLRYPRAEYTKTLINAARRSSPQLGDSASCAEPSCAGWPGGSHGMYDAEKKGNS